MASLKRHVVSSLRFGGNAHNGTFPEVDQRVQYQARGTGDAATKKLLNVMPKEVHVDG